MHQVIHLLPYDGIGGAEAAARSMLRTPWKGLDFRLWYIFPSVESPVRRGATFNPLAFVRAALGVTRERPDLLILSLWRSCVVGILAKAFRPRTRMVVVIHNSVDAHPADWLFTRIAMRLATEVWSDSQASLALRFRRMPKAPVHVLPFLTEHLEPAHSPGGKPPSPPPRSISCRIAGCAISRRCAPAAVPWCCSRSPTMGPRIARLRNRRTSVSSPGSHEILISASVSHAHRFRRLK